MGRIQPKRRREDEETAEWTGDVLLADDHDAGNASG